MPRYKLPPRPSTLSLMTVEQIGEFRRLWNTHSRDEVARAVGIGVGSVPVVAKSLGLPPKGQGCRRKAGDTRAVNTFTGRATGAATDIDDAGGDDPTEEQIAAACLAIQTRWTADDFDMRSRGYWNPNEPEVERPELSRTEARGLGFDATAW